MRYQVILGCFDILAPHKIQGPLDRCICLVAGRRKGDSIFHRGYLLPRTRRKSNLDRYRVPVWAELELSLQRAILAVASCDDRIAG